MVEILLVEDDPADADLAREVLQGSKLHLNLRVVQTADECLRLLREDGERPDLLLLDLNLPGMSGQELLAELKRDPVLRRIPIVVLTSSSAERDVVMSYDLGANCYVTKPVDLDQFVHIVNSIEQFWLTIVRLPSP